MVNKSKTKKKVMRKKVHRPEVVVSIPRNAKLTVKRKKRNPYRMDVTESPQGTTTRRTWYSPDYNPSQAQ